jgi:hypothetical protein
VDYEGRSRIISSSYSDPLDLVWVTTLDRLGIRLKRSPEVFASWDGERTMTISDDANMDPDDCVAQMILHELCHGLVAGPERILEVDWGLPLLEQSDHLEEHATNRLQAALAGRHGLRRFFGTTTVYRLYYDALPEDPLADDGDPAVALARLAYARATEGPWARALEDALSATAAIAERARSFAGPSSLWGR